jgi:hypothetical protein
LICFKGPSGFFGQYCEYYIPTATSTITTTTATTTTTTTTINPMATTTLPSVVPCSASIATQVCKNNAQCYIVNSANIFCLCSFGFTGKVNVEIKLKKN